MRTLKVLGTTRYDTWRMTYPARHSESDKGKPQNLRPVSLNAMNRNILNGPTKRGIGIGN